MTSVSNNVYINKLDDIVNKYNNSYHSTMKIKPVDVNSNTYIDFSKKINDENPKYKIGYNVRISKYKKKKKKVTLQIKNTVAWTYVINDLHGKEIVGTFYE